MNTLTLEKWMRIALLATAGMNLSGAIAFVPGFPLLRASLGLPEAPPFYLWLLSFWIAAFGFVYLSLGLSGRPDRAFVTIAALGKLSFWGLLFLFWLQGAFPLRAPIAGAGDLIFGLIFLYWLWKSARATGNH